MQYLTIAIQGRLIYPNSPVLEENFSPDGQEEVVNVRTPITSTPCPVVLLVDLGYQHQSDLQPLHWAQRQLEV